MWKQLFKTRTSKVLAITAVFAVGSAIGLSLTHNGQARAADCDNNAIMRCGFNGSPADFVAKVQAAANTDLPTIYSAYGLAPSQYAQFVTSARPGTAYKDGRIVVDGQVVGTNATSIGRMASYQGPGYFTQNIGGTNYYGNSNSRAFAADSIPVEVMFNAQGVMQFAVLTSCGNPTTSTPVTPTYSCDLLQKTAVAGKLNTYSFTTAASAGNNAQISKVVYDFGDGTTVEQANPATPVEHTYTQNGTFTAKVTVYVHLPGNQTVTAVSAQCATQITVQIPYYECTQLLGAVLDASKYQYRFTATARFGNGATFKDATVNFGDSQSAAATINGNTATVDHTYGNAGTYTVTATLRFNVGNDVQSVSCKTSVSPNVNECLPGVPTGSPMCSPCTYNSTLPSNSPQCQAPPAPQPAPQTLVNAGPGQLAGLFAGAGSLGTAGHYWFSKRRRK